ncbi:MAG: hypothetical protein ACMXYC_03485 [Candidatus Woesearchaeota archaeon]
MSTKGEQEILKELQQIRKRQADFGKRILFIEQFLDLKPKIEKIQETSQKQSSQAQEETSGGVRFAIPIIMIAVGVFTLFSGFGFFALILS